MILQQKCPYCDETLEFEVSPNAGSKPNDRGGVNVTIQAKTTPASTAHVWTHAPEAAK